MATKIQFLSFQRDAKTIYGSLLQNFCICFTSLLLNQRTVRHLRIKLRDPSIMHII